MVLPQYPPDPREWSEEPDKFYDEDLKLLPSSSYYLELCPLNVQAEIVDSGISQ